MRKKITCLIPARLNSSRFPQKILKSLHGKPLIQHTWEAAKKIPLFDQVLIAVDAEETFKIASHFGAPCLMTPENCPSGTARIAYLKNHKLIDGEIFVNWQVDEPFIHQAIISDLLQTVETSRADVWTLKKKIRHQDELESPHIPKVVTNQENCALYFSRSPIPYHREITDLNHMLYYKHIGLYAFTAHALDQIAMFSPSNLEHREHLEQLTFLYHGLKVEVNETQYETLSIDLPEHLQQAKDWMN